MSQTPAVGWAERYLAIRAILRAAHRIGLADPQDTPPEASGRQQAITRILESTKRFEASHVR